MRRKRNDTRPRKVPFSGPGRPGRCAASPGLGVGSGNMRIVKLPRGTQYIYRAFITTMRGIFFYDGATESDALANANAT